MTKAKRWLTGSVTCVVAMLFASAAGAQTVVTHCGGGWSGVLVLAGDLDCSGLGAPAIILEKDAHLDLAGFSVIGGQSTGVSCARSCTISGAGGTIASAALAGVQGGRGTVSISDVTISDNGAAGIDARPKGTVEADAVVVINNGWGTANETFDGGIGAKRIRATGCTVSGNRHAGLYAHKRIYVSDSISSNNQHGVYPSGPGEIHDSTLTGNSFYGVFGQSRVTMTGSTVVGNAGGGAWAAKGAIRIADSTFSNNGGDAHCDLVRGVACADISSRGAPHLENVSCETSARYKWPNTTENEEGYLGPWGVCSND